MITGSVSSAILGTVRSFAADYYTFLLFEFLDSVASSGVYSATLILGEKRLNRKSRVFGTIISKIIRTPNVSFNRRE